MDMENNTNNNKINQLKLDLLNRIRLEDQHDIEESMDNYSDLSTELCPQSSINSYRNPSINSYFKSNKNETLDELNIEYIDCTHGCVDHGQNDEDESGASENENRSKDTLNNELYTDLMNNLTISIYKFESQERCILDLINDGPEEKFINKENDKLVNYFNDFKKSVKYYIIVYVFLLMDCSKKQIKISLLLLKIVLKKRSHGDYNIENTLSSIKCVLKKSLKYQLKLKDVLNKIKYEKMPNLESLKSQLFISKLLRGLDYESLSNYINKLDFMVKKALRESSDQIFSINNTQKIINMILWNINYKPSIVSQIKSVEQSDITLDSIQFYKKETYKPEYFMNNFYIYEFYTNQYCQTDFYDIDLVVFDFFNVKILKKLGISTIEEVFNDLEVKQTHLEEDCYRIYGEYTSFDKLKDKIKIKIRESSIYKRLLKSIGNQFRGTARSSDADKGATIRPPDEDKVKKDKLTIKSFFYVVLSRDLRKVEQQFEKSGITARAMKLVNNNVFLYIAKIIKYTNNIERLFSIFNKFPNVSRRKWVDSSTSEVDCLVENKGCSICLDPDLLNNYGHLIRLDCGHVFHKPCLYGWIIKNKSCPNCRNSVSNSVKTLMRKCEVVYQYIISKKEFDRESMVALSDVLNWIIFKLKKMLNEIELLKNELVKIRSNLNICSLELIIIPKDDLNFILERFLYINIEYLSSSINDIRGVLSITFELSHLYSIPIFKDYYLLASPYN